MLLLAVKQRILTNRHATGSGSWLLGDEHGRLYVLREVSISTEVELDEHLEWVVGLYCADHANGTTGIVSANQLRGDLTAHFVTLGYVTEQTIRDAIRDVEG